MGLCIAFFLVFSGQVSAATYGSGHYNYGKYGVGEVPSPSPSSSSSTNSTSAETSTTPAITPSCDQSIPGTPPRIYAAISSGQNKITLYFTDSGDPYDHYALTYGLQPSNYSFGSDHIGEHGLRTYTVGSLTPNTMYYFKVRAGNSCAAGGWSNEFHIKTLDKKALFTTTSISFIQSQNLPIIKTNIDLDTPPVAIPSPTPDQTPQPILQPISEISLKVKVVNQKQVPLKSVKVTLHSTPQIAFTDENGVATFSRVEKGEHQLTFVYNESVGQENIVVQNENLNVKVTVQDKTSFLTPTIITIAIVLGICLVLGLGILFFARRRKNDN